jgi:pimeloyl-ACP methyl ester carboxylesterase
LGIVSPFVLLHGGRHGGWCWQRVATRLRAAGHDVYTPTFTGLGERSHLLRPDIGLSTHVDDVIGVFDFEDLTDAVVVAHSYAGMVAMAAMDILGDRVRSLVFLDANMPLTGESVFDIIGPVRSKNFMHLADEQGDGWYLPPGNAAAYGVTERNDAAWVNSKSSAQPLASYREPVGSTDRAWTVPGMFIECSPSNMEPHILSRARERSARDEHFRYRVLDAPHDAMVTSPGPLVHLLLEALDIT